MGTMLRATDLGEIFNLSARKINIILAELGYQERENGYWWITEKGRRVSEATTQDNGYGGSHQAIWARVTWDESLIPIIREYLYNKDNR